MNDAMSSSSDAYRAENVYPSSTDNVKIIVASSVFVVFALVFIFAFKVICLRIAPRLRQNRSNVDDSEGTKKKDEDLESLGPTFLFCGGDTEDCENQTIVSKECVVCLSEYKQKESLKRLIVCGHVFHQVFISSFLLSCC